MIYYLRLATDAVINQSTVPGTTLTNVLDNLYGLITTEDLWDRSGAVTYLKNTSDQLLVGITSTALSKSVVMRGTSQFGSETVIAQTSQMEIVGGGFNFGLGVHHFSSSSPANIGPTILQTAGNGTPASPTATSSGQQMGGFLCGGVNDTPVLTGSYVNGIVVKASEAWTTTAQGAEMRFYTTENGTTTGVERLRISDAGFFGFRVAPSTYFHFQAAGSSGVSISEQFFYENNNVLSIGYGFTAGANCQWNIYEAGGESWQMAFDGSSNEFHFFNSTVGQWLVQRSTEVVINEAGASIDTRTESDTNSNALFLRGSDGFYGIGTGSPDRLLHAEQDNASNNSVTYIARITHTTSGTPAIGIGTGLEFETETANGNNEVGLTIEGITQTLSAGNEDFYAMINVMSHGALANALYIDTTKIGVYGGVVELSPGFVAGKISYQSNQVLINGGSSGIQFQDSSGTGRAIMDSSNNWGFGTLAPESKVHIFAGSAGTVTAPANTVLTIENSTTAILQFLTPNTNTQAIQFGDPESQNIGSILYTHSTNALNIKSNGTTNMIFATTGISLNSANQDLDVAIYDSSGNPNLVSDAGASFVSIGSATQYGGSRFQVVTGTNNYAVTQGTVNTTDATVTAAQTIAIPTTKTVLLEARVVARRTGGASGTTGDSAGYVRIATVKNIAGTVSIVSPPPQTSFTAEDQVAWNATMAVSGTNIVVNVTGAAGNNITWDVTTIYQEV